MLHSNIVGGSTAKRVINCPASVALCAKMPPKPSSTYADKGTLLHDAIALILDGKATPESVIGNRYENEVLTQDLYDEKLAPALAALDEIDPDGQMEYAVEQRVSFGDLLPDVFGSTDLLGRLGDRAIVLDWKFGDGVAVDATENEQGLFYAAAAMRTAETQWVFDRASEIEIIIVQPPSVKRWLTTPERVAQFERDLVKAVANSKYPTAAMKAGDWCKWCSHKPVCKVMTGAVDRALKVQLQSLDAPTIGAYLQNAEVLEQWIKDLRELAHQMLEGDVRVPGYKLVAKRAIRQWVDEAEAAKALAVAGLDHGETIVAKLVSPAQAEKLLKKSKQVLPDELVVAVSSGSTLAPEDDPRPALLNIGKQLADAVSKLN